MRLLLSYAFDWISLIAVAGIAAALGHIDPAKRPFSLVNPDISCVFVTPRPHCRWQFRLSTPSTIPIS